MWFIQCNRLVLCLGICLFVMVVCLETVETRGSVDRRTRFNRKGKNGQRPRAEKKKANRKFSMRKKMPSKPTLEKKQTGSDTQISVYNCPSEAVEMNCLSCKAKVYRECPVTTASKITQVHVLTEYPTSNGKCDDGRKKNFGILGDSNIWVNYGCRAKFLICYEKKPEGAKHEPKYITCTGTTSKHRCPTGFHGLRLDIDIQISVLWTSTPKSCTKGVTWGYEKDDIWVDRGCSATFRVLW